MEAVIKMYGRTWVPVRDMDRERASSGSGPVTTYQMTPEELEEYRARTGYKGKPVQEIEQKKTRGEETVSKSKSPDKQEFLKLIAAGSSIAAAEREMGLKPNAVYHWLKKWGLTGINPDKARELLGEGASLLRSTSIVAQAVESKVEVDRLEKRMRDAEGQAATAWSEVEALRDRAIGYEEEIARLAEDRDTWKQVAEERKCEIEELSEFLDDALQRIKGLEQTSALGGVASEADNVNQPAHYTIGGIETIDFIRSKLTPEEFRGYCKGNALKYVTRELHKNGDEDLRKAGVYLGWAVGGER